MKKIVVNKCYGGFSLSSVAILRLQELGFSVSEEDQDGRNIDRDNPFLVQVVEELGDKANGKFAQLTITKIPDDVDWKVSSYDGVEHVVEKHRVW